MDPAEATLLVALLPVPLVVGALSAWLGRPWQVAALVAIAIAMVAVIAPTPESGPRVAPSDVPFLFVVAAAVLALAWVGHWAGRRALRSDQTGL